MPRIARALVWKEWREQRLVVLAGLGLTLAMPLFLAAGLLAMRARGSTRPGWQGQGCPCSCWGSSGRCSPPPAAPTTIANEIGDRTIGFLLSRPVSRGRVWLLKVATGAFALARSWPVPSSFWRHSAR